MSTGKCHLAIALVTLTSLSASGCAGDGGSSSFDASAELLAVTFPDPNGVNPEPEDAAPDAAPLVQQIVLTFSGRPDPDRVSGNTLPVRDAAGLPVAGRYTVDGAVVTFTPTLPLRPIIVIPDGPLDTGGTALEPGASYTLRVAPTTFSFVADVAQSLRSQFPDPIDPHGALISFRTTVDPELFFAGLPPEAPGLASVDPADGETGVSPNLYTDPDGRFAPRRTFSIRFDRPLRPDAANVSDSTFRLIDLDDRPIGFSQGLPLGIDVELVENEIDRSVVRVTPSGILPFGHLLALECPSELRSLSEPLPPAPTATVVSTFTIATDSGATIRDSLVEDFDTADRRETDLSQLGAGNLPADWDAFDSNVLQAGFAFQGDGVLGRFAPPGAPDGDTSLVTLDTTRQVFPLPDGSTPDAPPGFEVVGGVFAFTEIDIPDGVVVKPVGSNPLVLTATGSVHIAGDIVIAGGHGSPENGYDSAVTSLPGGQSVASGGRGGEGHPILFHPPDQISYLTLVSPSFGGTGYGVDPADGIAKRIGGTGGQCGCYDQADGFGKYSTNQEIIDCGEFRPPHPPEKVPGGGGGSHYRKGSSPLDTGGNAVNGNGNVLPDGTGAFTARDDFVLLCGNGGVSPLPNDGNADNDFFGSKGQLTRMFGGQGGGGGASLTDSYYCGNWCQRDADPHNDLCCCTGSGAKCDPFVLTNTRAPSVGDSRGGGGGAGGGALLIQALGSITLDATADLDARGGNGMGGEGLGCTYWGGGGGGGAGGMIVLQSATSILVPSGATIDVSRGSGDSASDNIAAFSCDEGDTDGNTWAIGDGGHGGNGMIQLQVPAGTTATVVDPTNSLLPSASWVDSTNTLNPVEFTPLSVALSDWFDLGRVTARPPAGTNPVFTFGGLDVDGFVITDADGNVLSPSTTDIVCGYLGQRDPLTGNKKYKQGEEPRADFIPTNATVKVEFQGAAPIVEGSKEIDPATLTPWSRSPLIANGLQFLRWRITFDVTADGSALSPDTRLPMVERIEVHAEF